VCRDRGPGGCLVDPAQTNHLGLLTDTIDLFAATKEVATATTVDKGHGRLERRTIRVSGELVGDSEMPGLAQVAEVRTKVTMLKTGESRDQVRYLFTSLTPAQASPDRLLALSRGHWRIENTLFHGKDDSFGEDRHVLQRHRSGAVLCGLRNAAMTLLRGSSGLWTVTDPMTARAQYLAAWPLAFLTPPSRL
jgi:hypothetical protein